MLPKVIKMFEIKMNTQIRDANAILSQASQTALQGTLANMLAEFNNPGISEPIISFQERARYSFYTNDINIIVHCDAEYDLLANHKNTVVTPSQLVCVVNKLVELTTHGVVVKSSIIASCALPKEDYNLLMLLGKIKTNYTNSSAYATVQCDI
jgi:hypothetical protein